MLSRSCRVCSYWCLCKHGVWEGCRGISICLHLQLSVDRKRGQRKGGHVKKRQKSSKSVKNIFGTFQHFSRRAKNVKILQKVPKIFSTLFDNFRVAPVFRPLLGSSETLVSRGRCGRKIARLWRLRPWSLRASLRLPKPAATFFLGVCDWYAGSPIGQCDGVRATLKKLEENFIPIGVLPTWGPASYLWLEGAGPMAEESDSVGEFLAIFWRFFCGRGPKADMPSQGIRA